MYSAFIKPSRIYCHHWTPVALRQEAQAAPAAQRRHDSLASGDGSLNFSLTEQTERPGGAGHVMSFEAK